MYKIILVLILCLSASLSWAQPGVAPTKQINGKTYYIHKVEAGNTLYGLHKMYSVEAATIMAENPFLKDGLKVGQEVVIPAGESLQAEEIVTSDYKVKKGETLYGISRQFNTTVDNLIALNPETKDGIVKGQVLKVPGKYSEENLNITSNVEPLPNPFVVDTVQKEDHQEEIKVSFSDSTVHHTVLAHETMYSISKRFMVSIEKIMKMNNLSSTSLREGQVLIIPVKQERIEKTIIKEVPPKYDPNGTKELVFERKDRYKVAILAPFFLDYGKGYSQYVSGLATHFYMGATMALDSLKGKGLKADIYFFDSRNDSATVQSILKSADFKDMDLVIGPFFNTTRAMVAEHCKKNNIRMVSPVSMEESLLEGNRLLYSAVQSDAQLMEGLVDYLSVKHAKDNIVLIGVTKEEDKVLYEAFKLAYKAKSGMKPLTESTIDGLKYNIQRGVNTLFIVPTSDKNTSMKFMNSLNRSAFRSSTDNIFVFGMKAWMNFSDVNSVYRNKYNFHFPSANHLDYYRDDVIEFNKKFRAKYNTDLSRMAAQGYDIVTYFCSSFFLENDSPHLFMNDFQLEKTADGSGYTNKKTFIVEQEEFELFDAEIKRDE